MLAPVVLALLVSSAWPVAAAPATELATPDFGLRLIKTSPEDAGKWVTEEQKIRDYKSKGIGFVDITDIEDAQVIAALSAPDNQEHRTMLAQAATYPSNASHQT